MKRRALAVLLLVFVALLGGLTWFALRAPEPSPPPVPAPRTTTVVAPAQPQPSRPRVPRASTWTARGRGDVAGRVVEFATDRPLAGVAVSLTAASGPATTVTATTAADGAFTIEGVDAYDAWTLRVDAPEPLADAELAPVDVTPTGRTDVGTIRLAPEFDVPGIVVDVAGAPVAGAEVVAIRTVPPPVVMDVVAALRRIAVPPAAASRATSGADGRFRLRRLSPASYDVVARDGVHAPGVAGNVLVAPGAEKSEIRIVVAGGSALAGRVVRKGAGPVASVRVVAFVEPRGDAGFVESRRELTVTGADGRFRFPALAAGRWVVAAAPENGSVTVRDRVRIPTREIVEIKLDDTATLRGRVTGANGAPIADAFVTVICEAAKVLSSSVTSADGSYEMTALVPGRAVFGVRAAGYAPTFDDSRDAPLTAGANTHDFALSPGATARGVVVEVGTGAPVPGTQVFAKSSGNPFAVPDPVTTDAAGRFEIRGVPAGSSAIVAVKGGWYSPWSADDVAPPNGTKRRIDAIDGAVVECRIELARTGTVTGTVTLPSGAPAAGARVDVALESGGDADQRAEFAASSRSVLADAAGAFRATAPRPGLKFRVAADHTGFITTRSDALVAPGTDAVIDVPIRMRLGCTVAGRVTDAAGRGIGGAEVAIEPRWPGRGSATDAVVTCATDADGAFRAASVAPGDLVVRAEHPRFVPWVSGPLTAAESEEVRVDASLVAGISITGTVVDPEGRPVAGARVVASQALKQNVPGRQSAEGVSDEAGAFAVEGLSQTTHRVVATAAGFLASPAADVAPGGEPVRLVLATSFRIAGTVRVRGGEGIGGVSVRATRVLGPGDTARRSFQAVTRGDGAFEMTEVSEGEYTISAAPRADPRPNVLPAQVAGVAAGASDVVVEMEPGAVISGRVVAADGTDSPSGTVECVRVAEGDDERDAAARGTANVFGGRFSVEGLRPGRYVVNVRAAGGAPASMTVDANGPELRIALVAGATVKGRVVLADGTPGAGVRIVCPSSPDDGSTCDDDGRFVLRHVAPGTREIRFWQSMRGFRHDGRTSVEARDGDVIDAGEVKLDPPRAISRGLK